MTDSPEVAGRRARARKTALTAGLIALGIFVVFILLRGFG